MTELTLKVFVYLLWFLIGCETRLNTDLPLESIRTNMEYILTDCIASLSDLNTCLKTKDTLIRKLRNCDQALENALVCLSVLPTTKNAFARYQTEENGDISILPEDERIFDHLQQDNIDTILIPEARAGLAQYEDEDNVRDGILVKRGLGRCIHKCLQGPSGMSFIQCKSMCHK